MKTAELIRNDNLYRAIGGECWMATYQTVKTEDGVRYIKPLVRKVMVVKPVPGSLRGVAVAAVRGDSRLLTVTEDDLFDDRDNAVRHAVAVCESMDGSVMLQGCFRYEYVRPKPVIHSIEYRAQRLDSTLWTVQYRDRNVSNRWKPVIGLFRLTKWKAADCVKRLVAGDEIPGFWQVGTSMEFIELADNVE